jgi:hypothetical protein
MCVKILRVVVGRKKMTVLCIGNNKELSLLLLLPLLLF